MSVSAWVRWAHRWVSIVFVAVVAALFALLGFGMQPAAWLYFVPLAPLGLLAVTGLWMFFRPYLRRPAR